MSNGVSGKSRSEDFGEEIRALRVRYSSIVNYSLIIYRAFTSFLFSLVVIRRFPVSVYGLFSYIMAFIAFFIPVDSLWNFWSARFYARKRYDLSYTGFFLSITYSIVGALMIFLVLGYVINTYTLSLLASLIFLGQINYRYLSNILFTERPYIVGYVNIILETLRVVLAYVFIHIFSWGLMGVLADLVLVFVSGVLLDLYFLARLHRVPKIVVSFRNIMVFMKNSYIPVIQLVSGQITGSAERLFTTTLTGSTIFSAYLGVSYIGRSFIHGRGAFARSLSVRLLRSGSRVDIEDVFRLFIITSFLMAGGFIIYSKTILSFFKEAYIGAYILLILYSVATLIDAVAGFFSTIAGALERIDLYVSGARLKRSVLFKNPFNILIANILYFSIASLIFTYMYYWGLRNTILLLIPYPLMFIITRIFIVVIFYRRSIAMIQYSIPWREILASLIGVLGMALFSYFTGYSNFIIQNIYRDVTTVLLILSYSLIIYFTIIYVLSPWFRRVVTLGFKSLNISRR